MLKRVIKYVDFNGEKREEEFYFNLTKAELTKMELSEAGGLTQKIERLVQARDGKQIIEMFEEVILLSYGEKSPDGKRFIKNAELSKAFMETNAYSELFMEIATDAGKAAAFVNGILPPDITQPDGAKNTVQ